MKGTLFSADFVKDINQDLKLLEFNTDTQFTDASIQHIDYTQLLSVISSNNIDEVHLITKKIHENFVESFSQSLHESSSVTTFTNTVEELNTIYPTTIEDADNKFILRCAYDESAIFDSTYCKQKDELLKLYHSNNDLNSIPKFYISSSTDFLDNIDAEVNSDYSPDVLVKSLEDVHSSMKLYKIGGTGSIEENFQYFLDNIGDGLVVKYYENELDEIHKSIRSFNIIYGTNLDIVNLTTIESEAILEKPTELEYNPSSVINLVDSKHYYEFTTNFPKFTGIDYYGGVFEDESISDVNGNPVVVSETVVGDNYKSLIVSGSPDSDDPDVYISWFHSGSVPPTMSETSSLLVIKTDFDLKNKLIGNITTQDSASFRANPLQPLLVYDSVNDGFRYLPFYEVTPFQHKLIKLDSSLVEVSSNDFEILEDNHKVYVLDMEAADTFVLHEMGINFSIISHNACFPAGTKILLENGEYKNIEEIQSGDALKSYDIEESKFVSGNVGSVNSSIQKELIHIECGGDTIKSTPNHKFYTTKGWKLAGSLTKDDILLNQNAEEVKIDSIEMLRGEFEVYHIMNVSGTKNYFAENILVHNFSIMPAPGCFIAGTEVTLASGDIKNIEDIVVGENVLTYNEDSGVNESGVVGDLKQHEVNSVIRLTLDNENIIITTEEHPFFVDGKGWVKAGELQPLDVCRKVDGSESLISTVEVLEETHTVYNLLSVSENHNFFVNEILVHNK